MVRRVYNWIYRGNFMY